MGVLSVGNLSSIWAAVVLLFYLRRFLLLGVDYLCWEFVYLRGFFYCYWAFSYTGGVLFFYGFSFLLHPGRVIYCRTSTHVARVLMYGWVVVVAVPFSIPANS